jgi:hypothetical protein
MHRRPIGSPQNDEGDTGMAAARTPTSDKTLADLTKVITAGKPFTRAGLAKRFKVAPDKVSAVVAGLKREGWQVEMTKSAFQAPATFVVTRPAIATAGGGVPGATEASTEATVTTGSAAGARPRRRARAVTGGRVAPTGLPVLGEMFEVVLLARNPDGSTSVGLRSATSGEVRVTWPS